MPRKQAIVLSLLKRLKPYLVGDVCLGINQILVGLKGDAGVAEGNALNVDGAIVRAEVEVLLLYRGELHVPETKVRLPWRPEG